MSELSASLQFLKAQLAGVAPGGAWPGIAPPNTPTPYITIQPYGASDTNGVAGTRLLARLQWLIEAWGPSDAYAAIEAAAKQMDTQLQLQRNVVMPDGQIGSCVRTQPRFNYQQIPGSNLVYIRQGGVYLIDVIPQ